MFQNTYEVGGKAYPVTGFHVIDGAGSFPVVDVPLCSDYAWQLGALADRLAHPNKYAATEDVPAVIERIKVYLEEHQEAGKAEGLYEKYLALTGKGLRI